jgi:hypothetical protein
MPVRGRAVPTARGRQEGRGPVLGLYQKRRRRLRGSYKGTMFRAIVRKDGSIRFKGERYTSPSLAAAAACGHATNGWWFWKYERAPGDWVRLRELRK